jgi:pyruvate dehydrogenase E2 component (dihydrolipoamide acetyltransferase)
MQEGTILSWLKSDGDMVRVGDELLEIETDKATVAYESPAEGALAIVANVGSTLPVGAVIATLGERAQASDQTADDGRRVASEPGRAAADEPGVADQPVVADQPLVADQPVVADQPAVADEPAVAAEQVERAPGGRAHSDSKGVRATPLARRLARERGVDLAALRGTGPGGRITKSDITQQAGGGAGPVTAEQPRGPASGKAPLPSPVVANGPPQTEVSDGDGAADTQELTRAQRVIARRMSESKATIPHFQVQTEARMDAVIGLRAQLEALGEAADPVPSVNDFVVKASAVALRSHPRANGSYRDGRFEFHRRINVGIAIALPDGLVVATVTGADERPLRSIAIESRRLARRVRDGSVTPPELSGATFTVSNLGMYGMTAIAPVINPPQAAILGVGAIRAVPALVDDRLSEQSLMTLTLSCDHRILYGADAARFLSDIRDALQAPLQLLL